MSSIEYAFKGSLELSFKLSKSSLSLTGAHSSLLFACCRLIRLLILTILLHYCQCLWLIRKLLELQVGDIVCWLDICIAQHMSQTSKLPNKTSSKLFNICSSISGSISSIEPQCSLAAAQSSGIFKLLAREQLAKIHFQFLTPSHLCAASGAHATQTTTS